MIRREHVAVPLLCAVVLVTGCLGEGAAQTGPTATATSADTPSETRTQQCAYRHEFYPDEPRVYTVHNYTYSNLSETAREIVDTAKARDGYVVEARDEPTEAFRYYDQSAGYRIVENDTTYYIVTYTSSVCKTRSEDHG